MCVSLHVKYLLFFFGFQQNLNFLKIINKYSNIRFNEDPSSGSEVGPCIHTEMMKLIVTFCNFMRTAYKDLHKFEPTVIRLVTSKTGSCFICSSGRLADSLTSTAVFQISETVVQQTDKPNNYASGNLYHPR